MKFTSDIIKTISISVVTIVVFISLTTSYAQENFTQVVDKLNVLTSVAPITNIVQNIGGEKINLIGLVPEGINSHTFDLVPSDVIKINNADLIIIDGLNLEVEVEKTANNAIAKNSKIHLLKLGDNTVAKGDWIFDFSFPKEKGDPNPHLWLNVDYAHKICKFNT
jgi:ABC-type Zn uptake system ZnuABC Zn-binding protein ZnuA